MGGGSNRDEKTETSNTESDNDDRADEIADEHQTTVDEFGDEDPPDDDPLPEFAAGSGEGTGAPASGHGGDADRDTTVDVQDTTNDRRLIDPEAVPLSEPLDEWRVVVPVKSGEVEPQPVEIRGIEFDVNNLVWAESRWKANVFSYALHPTEFESVVAELSDKHEAADPPEEILDKLRRKRETDYSIPNDVDCPVTSVLDNLTQWKDSAANSKAAHHEAIIKEMAAEHPEEPAIDAPVRDLPWPPDPDTAREQVTTEEKAVAADIMAISRRLVREHVGEQFPVHRGLARSLRSTGPAMLDDPTKDQYSTTPRFSTLVNCTPDPEAASGFSEVLLDRQISVEDVAVAPDLLVTTAGVVAPDADGTGKDPKTVNGVPVTSAGGLDVDFKLLSETELQVRGDRLQNVTRSELQIANGEGTVPDAMAKIGADKLSIPEHRTVRDTVLKLVDSPDDDDPEEMPTVHDSVELSETAQRRLELWQDEYEMKAEDTELGDDKADEKVRDALDVLTAGQ